MPDAFYDDTTLIVDTDGLKGQADALRGLVRNVADSLSNIENTLASLKLGWAGRTADEAQDFGRQWEMVMKEMFGGEGHPEAGVLNAIIMGLLTIRSNFAHTENSLHDFFKKFGEGLEGGSSEPPTSAPPNIDDVDLTAIAETY